MTLFFCELYCPDQSGIERYNTCIVRFDCTTKLQTAQVIPLVQDIASHQFGFKDYKNNIEVSPIWDLENRTCQHLSHLVLE
jgi:hypothetical protein